MAEGVIGGILGEESEKPEVEAPDALAGAEAFAAAVAAIASRQDPQVARDTSAFLNRQSRLLEIQARHLEDEHSLRLALLRGQRLGQVFRIGFQLIIVLALITMAIGFLAMLREAVGATGVVIEAFQVPPDLAGRGLTGQVVAKQILDHLADMQATTKSVRPADSYSNNWRDDLKVEIPATGISFGELRRYLHESLGHETRISGEIYTTSAGITVSARMGEQKARSFSGTEADLPGLVRQAAESVYEQTQAYRYAVYLAETAHHDEEAVKLLERLAHDSDPLNRGWAHAELASIAVLKDADYAKAAIEDRAALREFPGLALAKGGVVTDELELGHDAVGLEFAEQCAASARDVKETLMPSEQRTFIPYCRARISALTGDYPALVSLSSMKPATERERQQISVFRWVAQLDTHDLDTADEAEELSNHDVDLYFNARLALDRGDPHALELWSAMAKLEDDPTKKKAHDYMLRRSGTWLALAKARFGDLAGARALIAEMPTDCRMCVDFRGRIAALDGDPAAAEKWFAQAIDLAPKLPQVYIDRGQARLDRGDTAGALVDASQAATLSPHDGDAWKLWGDALAKQGNGKDALAKYDEALKYAPKWKQLNEARAALATRKT
jgi:tetratricopeptide (TPR) repeat protein